MFAPTVVFLDRPELRQSLGVAVDRAGIVWERGGGDRREAPLPGEPLGPTGAAALYRRALLADIGLFSGRFGTYLEDVDLAWRARHAGWTCGVVPVAVVRHALSATTGANSQSKRFHLGRNKWWLITRNYPGPALARYLPVIVAYDLLSLLGLTLLAPRSIPFASRLSALKGRVAALLGLWSVIADRRALGSRRRIDDRAAIALLEPVASPFAVRRRFGHLPEGGSS